MKRAAIVYLGALIVVLTGLVGSRASAQYFPGPRYPTYNPYSRPTYSPYLNLLRSGNPAVNYYGLVRPEQDTRLNFLQLQQNLYTQSSSYDAALDTLITGNRGSFLNYQRYFQNNRGPGVALPGGSALGALGAAPQAGTRGAGVGTSGAGYGRSNIGTSGSGAVPMPR
jgi:hypothetical protein